MVLAHEGNAHALYHIAYAHAGAMDTTPRFESACRQGRKITQAIASGYEYISARATTAHESIANILC